MNLFKNSDIKKINSLVFDFIDYKYGDHIFSIILNRPQKKNALHPQMINELAFLCQYAQLDKKVKVVLIKACLLYTSPSPRDRSISRMPSSA